MPKLNQRQHDELESLVDFFRAWYGEPWELQLRIRLGINRRTVANVLAGRYQYNAELVARLNDHRAHLESLAARHTR